MNDTKIEWADDTLNPWWGCSKVSEACANCYAETLDRRLYSGANWGMDSPRRIRVEAAIQELLRIERRGQKEGKPRRIFIASMSDIFERRPDLDEPRKIFWDALHRLGPGAIPMILTKRPDHMAEYAKQYGWPERAWAGTTCETQRWADERIPYLLQVPARVRFVSCEPLLGPLDMFAFLRGPLRDECLGILERNTEHSTPGLNWIIVGAESGVNARPMHPDWARSLRDQCQAAKIAFHFKQWGEWGLTYCYTTKPDAPAGTLLPTTIISSTDRTRVGATEYFVASEVEPKIGGNVGVMRKLGKKNTGRLLDGREWSEVPNV
jgi:protein gp37